MNDFLFVRIGKEYTRLFFSEIIYIESLKNYVRIVTPQAKFMIKVTMSRVEKVLPKNQFCRIHRCCIVALKSISGFNHDNVHINGKNFSIGEQYRKILFDRIITLEGEAPSKSDITNGGINKFGLN
ncbi:MAG: LytTR family DNA-binding domain-containing protein [Bacteroidota bacterium]|nr:LytTR family DNA-binding domain-containing protein [Bacteroidota bacterium]